MEIKSFLKEKLAQSKTYLSQPANAAKTLGLTIFASASLYYSNNPMTSASMLGLKKAPQLSEIPLKAPNLRYGFNLDTFQVKEAKIGSSESLKDFLEGTGLKATQIDRIDQNCKGIFDTRTFRTGKEYLVLRNQNDNSPSYFCYSPDAFSHLVVDLKTQAVNRVQLPVETRIEMSSGIVESNLWNTMEDNGWSLDIIDKLEDALKCSVDFHHINEGDKFKLIYEQNYVNGKKVSTGKLLAGYFADSDREYHAIWYENGENLKGFFDAEGRPLKKTFLKSPLKFSHVTSRFGMRFHPILRHMKAHLGTDFAAPTGTPIMAIADGTVEEATRRGGNGLFVKLRHDGTYETQYLHMSRIGNGMRPGVRVMQGQTIGYVGSTGLATGPHVCFRFWKNGQQVNFLKANLPAPQLMDKNSLPEYLKFKDAIVSQMASIPYQSPKTIAAANP